MDDVHNDDRIKLLGDHIKALRLKAGYSSHEDFANEHGFAMKQYWRLESGYDFKISTLLRLMDAHNMSFEDFFKDFDA
jgi:transcriptional regulator with XRE-family HTH domain